MMDICALFVHFKKRLACYQILRYIVNFFGQSKTKKLHRKIVHRVFAIVLKKSICRKRLSDNTRKSSHNDDQRINVF